MNTVSSASITGMVVSLILCVAAPVALCILLKRKTGAKLSDMLLGAVTFVIFAMFLEQILHLAMRAVFGEKLTGNLWLSALYGGAAAAVFEEFGRLVAMKYFLGSQLEKENCPNPDEPASCFGELMAQLLVYREDMWAKDLGQMGFSLGRFIYLLDAAADYDKDKRKGKYNPYLAMGMEKDEKRWEEYLVLAMGRCAERYEKLPLVQDKALLDNILYSGVWVNYRGKRKEEAANDG